MITKLTHVTVYVQDQEEALKFYRDKLGFEVRTDHKMDSGFWWLTLGPQNQPDFELVLMEPTAGYMYDQPTADTLRSLIKLGALGGGVFETDNCQKTYEELKAKGVEFMGPPEERFYGIECVMKDNSGNWFSITQRKKS